jgi:hypothetical protein
MTVNQQPLCSRSERRSPKVEITPLQEGRIVNARMRPKLITAGRRGWM